MAAVPAAVYGLIPIGAYARNGSNLSRLQVSSIGSEIDRLGPRGRSRVTRTARVGLSDVTWPGKYLHYARRRKSPAPPAAGCRQCTASAGRPAPAPAVARSRCQSRRTQGLRLAAATGTATAGVTVVACQSRFTVTVGNNYSDMPDSDRMPLNFKLTVLKTRRIRWNLT